MITFENLEQVKEMIHCGCLLDYPYLKENYKLT